jgi:nucleotide-binding universal stress UspA family protein
VLVAYDGSRLAMKAVDRIARSSFFVGLSVTVVTVGTDTAAAQKGLEDAKALLAAAGMTCADPPRTWAAREVLGRLVEDEDFGMVVMGAYGHSRIRSFVIGSATTEMVRSCKVPVLLVH